MKEFFINFLKYCWDFIYTKLMLFDDLYKVLILICIGCILTFIVLYIGCKIDSFLWYIMPQKKVKKRKRI